MTIRLRLLATLATSLTAASLLALAGCDSSPDAAGQEPPAAPPDAAGSGRAEDAKGPACVRRGRFELRVSETGEFRPLRCRVVISQVGGKVEWLVPEGTTVKKGDRLFTLESTGTQEWLTRDSAELDAARKNLQEVRRQVQMERETIELEMKSREAGVKLAETRLAEVEEPPSAAELNEARAALESSRAAAADRRAAAEADARMARDGYLSAAEAESSGLSADLAAIDLQRTELKLATIEAGATRLQREAARLELDRTREEMAQARADAERREAELGKRLSDAEAWVASMERSVARAKRDLAAREVSADTEGVVIYRTFGHHREDKPEVGGRVWPGAGVLDVADLSTMKIRTQLAEDYIRHLKLGDVVRTAPDSVPGLELDAKVIWIDRWSRDRSADLAKADREREGLSGVKVFALEAALQGCDLRIRPGFRGKAEFRLLDIPDALIVPRGAIYGSGSERFVLAEGEAAARRVPVEVLAEDEREAAVRGELTVGQRLVTRGGT